MFASQRNKSFATMFIAVAAFGSLSVAAQNKAAAPQQNPTLFMAVDNRVNAADPMVGGHQMYASKDIMDNAPSKLIASSREDVDGVFSPDNKRIAFASDRSGSFEIWVSNSDGTNQVQLTSLNGATAGSPAWSPDSKTIAFDVRLEGHGDIFVISVEGGSPRRLTNEPFENNVPTWSRDGKWIYFSSQRSGSWQIWKMPAGGGTAIQVTKNGGFKAQESPDGKSLYLWLNEGNIWKMPIQGGETVRVLQGVQNFNWWRIAANGIYFVDASSTPARINFFDFATQRSKEITSVDLGYQVFGPEGIDISPDEQWILFKRVDEVDSDIMLVENFR